MGLKKAFVLGGPKSTAEKSKIALKDANEASFLGEICV